MPTSFTKYVCDICGKIYKEKMMQLNVKKNILNQLI